MSTLKLIKEWYTARAKEGLPTKNINSMSVMYSVACLLELDEERGRTLFDDDERAMYGEWIDEWAEWVMNDLPSEYTLKIGVEADDRNCMWWLSAQ